jgi:hypothetical protein
MTLKAFPGEGGEYLLKKYILIKGPQIYVYHIVDCLISIAEFCSFNWITFQYNENLFQMFGNLF